MLRQTIDGLYAKSLTFSSGSDEDALLPLLAGKVESYSVFGDGGTALASTPDPLNRKNVIVGVKTATGRISTMVTVPHVKTKLYVSKFSFLILLGKLD
ncbi:hypothetical protein, partial [Campylobacter concisus]|uniref:hypothetical protein n=1 Tax=Campylobacter concisus TaxID=199 RepID=UPI0009351CD8